MRIVKDVFDKKPLILAPAVIVPVLRFWQVGNKKLISATSLTYLPFTHL